MKIKLMEGQMPSDAVFAAPVTGQPVQYAAVPPGQYQAPPPGQYQQGYQQQSFQPAQQQYQPAQQQYPQGQAAGPNVVMTMPLQQGGGNYVPDYCFLSWFACLCCCWPIGCCAIIQSQAVQSRLAAGDVAGARVASNSARQLGMCATIFGFLVIGISLALYAGGVFVTTQTYTYYYDN